MLYIVIGIVSGIFSGIGMGGGTILIFALSFFASLNQHVAQAVNLIFFIPTSIAAIFINIKNKKIDFKLAFIVSICGIIGAIMGANIATNMEVNNLKKYFGIFIALVACHEIYIIIKEYIKNKKEA